MDLADRGANAGLAGVVAMKLPALLALVWSLGSTPAQADFVLRGQVAAVEDGDTVTVLVAGDRYTVRLAEIDAPEICHRRRDPGCKRAGQPGGAEAKAALERMALHREVIARCGPKDARYGREVCLLVIDGQDVNLLMVKSGWAWAYRQYTRRSELIQAEQRAQQSRLGLWGLNATRVAPWEWRKACWERGYCPDADSGR